MALNQGIVGDNGNILDVNSDGTIGVVPTAPSAPAAATVVDQSELGNVASTTGDDLEYTITNGTVLTVQILQGSAEAETGGSVIELFEDPNGDKSVLNQIGIPLVLDGAFDEQTISTNFTGDGTRRIILRRRGFTASSREVNGRWIGFEE